jgi:hypothetical protein
VRPITDRTGYLCGIEPEDVSEGIKKSCEYRFIERGAESGALLDDLHIIPPDLAKLVVLWENLPDTVKGDILARAESSVSLSKPPRHKTT